MAIEKNETQPNGVPLSYWRIVSLTCVVNNQSIIEVAGYVNAEKRREEQQANPEEGCDVYIDTRYITLEYDPNMSVSKAYDYIKTLPEFSDSTDVIELWSANTSYHVNDSAAFDGDIFTCLQSHTSQDGWEPPEAPALWRKSAGGDIQEWVQPTGSSDAYNSGDKVSHNGKIWESLIDANVWEPSESASNLWRCL